jgi:hypothetical protein
MRTHVRGARLFVVTVVGALSVTLGVGSASAAEERIAPPPSADALVLATNAMMRPADVSAPALKRLVGSDRRFSTGFFNPPGGQDPMPVCVGGPEYTPVNIPRSGAIGYGASYGSVFQYEYRYASAARASQAWKSLTSQVSSLCNSSYTANGDVTTNTARRIPGVPGGERGWGVVTEGKLKGYTAVHLIDDTIQMVTKPANEKALPSSTTRAIAALAVRLADRWATRADLPITQAAVVTQAGRTMVQPNDIPSTLPMATAADGGWSSFQGVDPGYGFFSDCTAQANLPSGEQSFQTSLFSSGGPLGFPGKGSFSQQVEQFASADEARAAWQTVTSTVAQCTKNATGPIPTTKKDFERYTNGTASVSVGGVPGVWSNALVTFPGMGKGSTQGSYTVYLLVDDSIQQFQYSLARNGIGEVTIDTAAVDSLAKSLADRWSSYTG